MSRPSENKSATGETDVHTSDSGRRVTINDVARIAGVSKKTVSRVINDSPLVREETRLKVKEIIRVHGFRPDPQARALAFRRSWIVCLAYDNPNPQYVVNMQRGILDVLDGTDYQLALQPIDRSSDHDRDRIHRFVESNRPAGVILTPSVSEDDELARALDAQGCHYVRVASYNVDTPERTVRTHDAEGAAEAARHLTALGHTRIAHIHGPNSFRSAHERLAGFRRGLGEYGLVLQRDLTIESGYTFESGKQAADQLLRLDDPPTAIFAGNDEMAMGAYVASRNAGLVIPRDVSIVGFDDGPMAARMWPPMTSVLLPIRDMGNEAAQCLLNTVNAGPERPRREFTPTMSIRGSTAPPRES